MCCQFSVYLKIWSKYFSYFKKKKCIQCILIILTPHTHTLPPNFSKIYFPVPTFALLSFFPLDHCFQFISPVNSRCGAFLSIVNRPAATPVKKNWLSFSQNPPAVHSTSGVGWGSTHQPFHPRMVTGLVLCKLL